MGLIASLEADEQKLKELTTHEGESDHGKSTEEETYQPDTRASRTRISSRRVARNASAPSQDEGQTPQDNGGEPRGSDGDTPGSSKESPGDGDAPQGVAAASRGNEQKRDVLEDGPQTEADWARYRRLMREKDLRIKELEAKSTAPADAEKPLPVKSRSVADLGQEPSKDEDLAGYLVYQAEKNAILLEQMQSENTKQQQERSTRDYVGKVMSAAQQDMESYKTKNPDFDNALAHGKAEYFKAVKTLMPQFSQDQIEEAFNKEIYQQAQACMRNGANIGEVLYDLAIERFGYTRQEKKGEKPALKVIANNQKRSASPLEGGGQSGAVRITLQQAAAMTPLQLMSLPQEDLDWLQANGF